MKLANYRECQIELGCLVEDYNRALLTLTDNLECKNNAPVEEAVEALKTTFYSLCCIVSQSLQG